MSHLTRYGKRIRNIGLKAILGTCFVCFFAIPFIPNKLLEHNVGCYSVKVNGVEVGYANSPEIADEALSEARLRFNREYDHIVYMDPQIEIKEENNIICVRKDKSQLASEIYSNLFSCVIDAQQDIAYTLRVGDYSVALESTDDVIQLLNKVREKYDPDNNFTVQLLAYNNSDYDYKADIVPSEDAMSDEKIIASALDGSTTEAEKEGKSADDGVKEMSFVQDVQVIETPKEKADIKSVDDAYGEIISGNMDKVEYYAKANDTLNSIALNYSSTVDRLIQINPSISRDTIIVPGDMVMVEVPQNKISIWTKQQVTYEEEYDIAADYVDDNSLKRNENKQTKGFSGHRKVVADVTSIDGVRTGTEYISEEVMSEAQGRDIRVGTRAESEYIRPISGGEFISGYGDDNDGVDWKIAEGNSVMASADGIVERAGWYAQYGYCIDIKHSSGDVTRYANLGRIDISEGDTVKQGQVIAQTGNTGYSAVTDEPHMHFELYKGGAAVNPLDYVDKNSLISNKM